MFFFVFLFTHFSHATRIVGFLVLVLVGFDALPGRAALPPHRIPGCPIVQPRPIRNHGESESGLLRLSFSLGFLLLKQLRVEGLRFR